MLVGCLNQCLMVLDRTDVVHWLLKSVIVWQCEIADMTKDTTLIAISMINCFKLR